MCREKFKKSFKNITNTNFILKTFCNISNCLIGWFNLLCSNAICVDTIQPCTSRNKMSYTAGVTRNLNNVASDVRFLIRCTALSLSILFLKSYHVNIAAVQPPYCEYRLNYHSVTLDRFRKLHLISGVSQSFIRVSA